MADTAGHLTTIAAGAAEQSEHSAGTNGALEEIRGAAENTSRNMEVFTASLLTFQSGMRVSGVSSGWKDVARMLPWRTATA